MRIVIAAVGRMKSGPERDLVARYLERAVQAGKPHALTGFDVLETPESRQGSANARKAEEARALEALLPEGVRIALDEHGRQFASIPFSEHLAMQRDAGRPALSLVIGGADGLDPTFVARCDLTLSLSAMTWPHQLVRILLAEQLYRATTILSNHPYHRP